MQNLTDARAAEAESEPESESECEPESEAEPSVEPNVEAKAKVKFTPLKRKIPDVSAAATGQRLTRRRTSNPLERSLFRAAEK
jgi:hypothetical protein